jgi:dTDP-4-dehydrorhamnose reductase
VSQKTSSRRVLVIGSSGFVGSRLAASPEFRCNETFFCSRSNAKLGAVIPENHFYLKDVKDIPSIRWILSRVNPDVVINCVAEADVKKCELDQDSAKAINTLFPATLALLSKEFMFRIVHFSTDAVFGQEGAFFREEDKPIPTSVYGATKLAGEHEVLERGHKPLILRIRPFGHDDRGRNLFDYFYLNLLRKSSVQGFSNVFFSPLAMSRIPPIVAQLIQSKSTGIYHLAGDRRISKFEFGRLIAGEMDLEESLVTEGFFRSTLVDRSIFDSSMSIEKLKSKLGLDFSMENDLKYEIEGMRLRDEL